MKYIDISRQLYNGMEVYPSDPGFSLRGHKSLKKGFSCNLCALSLGTHTGTHIDAPRHIIDGSDAVDKITFDKLICKALVTSIDDLDKTSLLDDAMSRNAKAILLKSGLKKASLNLKDADIIVKNGFSLVGTEEMSIEASDDKVHPAHRILLSRKIVIVENLVLKGVKKGFYRLICLPLRIRGGDGSPARAVLIDD
ncbi:MAG: cyclase family protein [Candidatus Omnitrophota bacterium]